MASAWDEGVRAANPPEGSVAWWGGERQNGLPYAEQVRYVHERELVLCIRTVLPQSGPPPVIGTVEDFGSVLANFRPRHSAERGRGRPDRELLLAPSREDERTSSRAVTIMLDDVSVPGTRKDFADCSVAFFRVAGVRIFCAASAELLDRLSLRMPARQSG